MTPQHEREQIRFDAEFGQHILERLVPNPSHRETLWSLVAWSIQNAHNAGSSKWGVTLFPNLLRLNFGGIEVLNVGSEGLWLILESEYLPKEDEEWLRNYPTSSYPTHHSFPCYSLSIPFDELDIIFSRVAELHSSVYKKAAEKYSKLNGVMQRSHSPSVINYLRKFLNDPSIPEPLYSHRNSLETNNEPAPKELQNPYTAHREELLETIETHFSNSGLHFTPQQIATFYTALQTKGFVVLSGISGTGKSKLAQHFAEMLPQPELQVAADTSEEVIPITVRPYMLKYNRMVIPQSSAHLFTPPSPGQTIEIPVDYEDKSQTCRFTHADYTENNYMQLFLRGGVRKWFQATFKEDDLCGVEPQIDEQTGDLRGFRIFDPNKERKREVIPNHLFLPVRPDWRDSKSLLGYYNPITERYEWTEFLRFLRRAERSFRAGDGSAWFVILDEMNLAHVEYYFADLLSVLESGRDVAGWTKEPLRFPRPQDVAFDAELPPARMHLPPNLYIVGTVNVDETTHAFSPKVLDRAFTIELNEVDFSAYPVKVEETEPLDQATRSGLLANFSFDGRFVHRDKVEIAHYMQSHSWVREQLQRLNDVLRPYGRHFGYRVFDEIVGFLMAADYNGLFSNLGGQRAAFDAAVLMKVLPKFHGSRTALESPLRGVLAWSVNPETVPVASVNEILDGLTNAHDIHNVLKVLGGYQYPATASRIQRMLWELHVNGFTAF